MDFLRGLAARVWGSSTPMQSVWSGLGSREVRVVVMGLDAAGKTSVLHKMDLGEVVQTEPTSGWQLETLVFNRIEFQCWDVGGDMKIFPLYRHYFSKCDAVVWVVDATDTERLEDARDELQRCIQDNYLQQKPLLVLANKRDLPGALTVYELAEKLGLHQLRQHRWYVELCSAVTGQGLLEGFDWLAKTLRAHPRR
eukprot:TRINITY_DN50330_c0_g1_i1.p1 TRINITY_DN50330_c0_g1~~TRINITY_DN50330_c0_g1_i1.p1  ORF type:complete len:218 (+),score=71.64 TRINITY_DN50330_c0_g1_i1:68-655(+)